MFILLPVSNPNRLFSGLNPYCQIFSELTIWPRPDNLELQIGQSCSNLSVAQSIKTKNRCAIGVAEANLAQILRGAAKEYLSQIRRCQAKARQFYSLYSEQLTNLSKTDQFEVPNCQVWSKLSVLKISDDMGVHLKIICEDLKLGGVYFLKYPIQCPISAVC